jgi:hypothetical protein
MTHKAMAIPPETVCRLQHLQHKMRSGSAEKTYCKVQAMEAMWEIQGWGRALHRTHGSGSGRRWRHAWRQRSGEDTSAAVGKGWSRVAHIGKGGPCEGGLLWRGEGRRFSPSPPSLSSSALHGLLTAILLVVARGPVKSLVARARAARARAAKARAAKAWAAKVLGSECSGTEGSHSGGSGRGDGDFFRCGVGVLGAAEEGTNAAAARASSDMVMARRWRCRQ